MSRKTKDMRFQSNYGGGSVTAAQYICELICTKKAMMSNKTLTHQFWKEAEWSAVFRRWLRPVHKLLKTYNPIAVVNALNDEAAGMKWSVHTEFMIQLIKKHEQKLKTEKRPLKVDPSEMEAAKQSVPRSPNVSGLSDILDADIEYVDMNMGND